jgi:hypothetical protein
MGNQNYKSKRLAQKRKRIQRTWLFLTLGGIFLIGLAFLVFRGNQNTGTLADVKLGQPVKVSFIITNVGDQPLRFSEQPYVEVVEGC